MKTYPIDSPPQNPGIYALSNRVTGQIYIGKSVNLHRRYAEWKGVFTTGLGAKNPKIQEVLNTSRRQDWDFVVLDDLPGASSSDLELAERRAIRGANKRDPDRVLNGLVPDAKTPEAVGTARPGASEPKSIVLSTTGEPITQREVARVLGITKGSVKQRLRKYRDRGVFEVRLDQWGRLHDQTP